MLDFKTKFGRFAKKHLKSEYFIWLTTVDSTGTPQRDRSGLFGRLIRF